MALPARALFDIVFSEQPAPARQPIQPIPFVQDGQPARYQKRGLVARAPVPSEQLGGATSLADLPSELIARIEAYLAIPDPGYMLLVAAPAGSGKTTIGIEIAERVAAAGYRVFFAGPRHDFFDDIRSISTRPSWWYEWQPRQPASDSTPGTCRYAREIASWMDRGYRGIDFCASPKICGWDYINNVCPYHEQRQTSQPIVFGQHAHVALGHPLMDQMRLVIGDELPMSAFLHEWLIPVNEIVPPDMDPHEPLTILLRNLQWLCGREPDDSKYWQGPDLYNAAMRGGVDRVLDILDNQSYLDLSIAAMQPDIESPYQAASVPYFHLPLLLNTMKREAGQLRDDPDRPIIARVRVSASGLTILTRRRARDLPPHVVWLDATGDQRIYAELFDRAVELVKPIVPLAGTIYQLHSSLNNKAALSDDRTTTDGTQRGARKVDAIREQVETIIGQRNYQSPAFISYKSVVDLLASSRETIAHFGGSRGTNRFQTCDALFVIGAPMPPIASILDLAAMLYIDRQSPWRDRWSSQLVQFIGTDHAYAVGGYWEDPDLMALLQQLREAEIEQAIHRARPIRRAVDVWLLTNIPTSLPVTLIGAHQLAQAVNQAGQPLAGIDVKIWPAVLSLARAASQDEPLTAQRLIDTYKISKPTALRWLAALLDMGEFTPAAPSLQTGKRGRPSLGIIPKRPE